MSHLTSSSAGATENMKRVDQVNESQPDTFSIYCSIDFGHRSSKTKRSDVTVLFDQKLWSASSQLETIDYNLEECYYNPLYGGSAYAAAFYFSSVR